MQLNVPCKAGRIQIENGFLRIVQPFGKVLWQAPTETITGLTATSGKITVNVTIYTTNDTYLAEMVTKSNFAKLQAAFPHLQVVAAGTPWYLNPHARSHVATYDNPTQMQREIEAAVLNGWIVAAQSGGGGHVNASKVIAGAMLAGGVGALAGSKRSKETITVTFARHPQWQPPR